MSTGPLLSLSTECLAPMGLEQVGRIAAEAGLDGLELVLGLGQLWHGDGWTQRVASSLPLPILSIHQPLFGFGHWHGPREWVGETVALALDLDVPVVVLHAPATDTWDCPLAQAWLAAVEDASRQVQGTATRLTVENEGRPRGERPPAVLGPLDALTGFCREQDLGLTYDTCHAGTLGADLVGELTSVGDLLANVHLSDYCPGSFLEKLPMVDVITVNHQMVGEGVLDLGGALRALGALGYRGSITYEISPFALHAWQPAARRSRLARALALARTSLESAHAGSASPARAVAPVPAE